MSWLCFLREDMQLAISFNTSNAKEPQNAAPMRVIRMGQLGSECPES